MPRILRPDAATRRMLRRKYAPLGRTVGNTLWLRRPEAVSFVGDCKARGLMIAAVECATIDGEHPQLAHRLEFPLSEWLGHPDGVARSASAILQHFDTCRGRAMVWAAFEFATTKGRARSSAR